MRRHSVDAEVAKNSLENRLAMGSERPRQELNHMTSQIPLLTPAN
jgi:hypothetical protein